MSGLVWENDDPVEPVVLKVWFDSLGRERTTILYEKRASCEIEMGVVPLRALLRAMDKGEG